MVNFSPLTAAISSGVWGTPANVNGFRVLAALLNRHHLTEDNQTLHDVSPSPGLGNYIYIVGHKKEPTYFCLYFVRNQRILMQFSLTDLEMNSTHDSMNFTHLT